MVLVLGLLSGFEAASAETEVCRITYQQGSATGYVGQFFNDHGVIRYQNRDEFKTGQHHGLKDNADALRKLYESAPGAVKSSGRASSLIEYVSNSKGSRPTFFSFKVSHIAKEGYVIPSDSISLSAEASNGLCRKIFQESTTITLNISQDQFDSSIRAYQNQVGSLLNANALAWMVNTVLLKQKSGQ